MTRIGRMAGVALALLAAGCSSSGNSPIERFGPIVRTEIVRFGLIPEDETPVEVTNPTRALLNQIPFATLAVGEVDGAVGFVIAVSDSGGYVVYQDVERNGVVQHGALVTATNGLPFNLSSTRFGTGDPIANPRPLAEWPATTDRRYRFRLQAAENFEIAVRCVYGAAVPEVVEIYEIPFDLVRVPERCANATRSFENVYWVDPANGAIWQSNQWIGPRQIPFRISVVRPYQAAR